MRPSGNNMCTFPSQSYWFPSCLHACNRNNLKYVKTKWIKTIKESHIWRAERQDLFCPADSLKRHLTVIFKPKSQTSIWSIFPMSRWGFACHLLGVLPSNHLWCFPSAPISCKQWREEEKKPKQLRRELMRLKWSISCKTMSLQKAQFTQ